LLVFYLFSYIFNKQLLHIIQNFNIELVLGFDTRLDQTIEPTKKPSCLIGNPGPPRYCCIEKCTPNCAADCIANQYLGGGRCDTFAGAIFCCCLKT